MTVKIQRGVFVDGLTESIINSLSQLPNLKVMSRNAAFRFKGSNLDPLEAGRTLNVGAVLTGRLVKVNNRLVIKTELIKVEDGSQLWGAEYNGSLADIFAVQDEVSKKIRRVCGCDYPARMKKSSRNVTRKTPKRISFT